MTRLRQMLGQERGFALVIALAVTFVFSMTVVTVIEAATSNSRSSDRSKGRVSAYSLAEAGINNAASILAKRRIPRRLPHRLRMARLRTRTAMPMTILTDTAACTNRPGS